MSSIPTCDGRPKLPIGIELIGIELIAVASDARDQSRVAAAAMKVPTASTHAEARHSIA